MLKTNDKDESRILDVLFSKGQISQRQIDEIKELSKKENKTTSEVLVEIGAISEESLAENLSKIYNFPEVDLNKEKIDKKSLINISKDEAEKSLALVFGEDHKSLNVALFDPAFVEKNNPNFSTNLRNKNNKEINFYIAKKSDIEHGLRYYDKTKGTKMVKVSKEKDKDSSLEGNKDILDILITQDLIEQKEAQSLRQESKRKKERIEVLLEKKGKISQIELAKAYASLYHLPYIRISPEEIKKEALTKFPEDIAKRYLVIPFDIIGESVLKVAIAHPYDPHVQELLRYVEEKNELEIDKFISTRDEIEEAIKLYQSAGAEIEKQKEIKEEEKPSPPPVSESDIGRLLKKDIKNLGELENIVKEGSVPKIVAAIINFAVLRRASDIHIQPALKDLRVRYRIDGVLNDLINISLDLHPAIVSRIKILSNLRIDEKRIPQDGRFGVNFDSKMVDIRVSTLPTTHGEKVVLRLLDTSQGAFTLDELGLKGRAHREFVKNISKPFGMIVATGPTGSGKTTSLYAALMHINKPGVNIVTLEDPVEYDISGLVQSQAKPDIGYDFADGLRAVLRQDPDIIMVGEIRDKETAGMAIHSALTGHLVFSTLHTNDASGALPRLVDMGIEPFLIISAVNLFIAQRLVRKICPYCKRQAKIPTNLREKLDAEIARIPGDVTKEFKKPYKFFEGKGCKKCSQGYFGRIGVFEVLPMTETMEKLTVTGASAFQIKKAAQAEGMITMKQDGLLKALEGMTTVEEVLRVSIS